MVWQGQQCQALQTEEDRTFAGQDDEQLCLHAHKVCIPAHNDWVLGVNGGAAAVFVTLVVDATEVKLTFRPADFGASCPSGLAFASDSAEVMPFWPGFLRIPQHKHAVGKVEGPSIIVRDADGIWGKHERNKAFLAKLVAHEFCRFSLVEAQAKAGSVLERPQAWPKRLYLFRACPNSHQRS